MQAIFPLSRSPPPLCSAYDCLAIVPLLFHLSVMGRVDDARLINMALAVLEEVAARSRHTPQPQSRGVALALAYLAHASRAQDRWPFDNLWRSMKLDCRVHRAASISASLNAIYSALGRQRDVTVMSAFEREATELYGPLASYSRQTVPLDAPSG